MANTYCAPTPLAPAAPLAPRVIDAVADATIAVANRLASTQAATIGGAGNIMATPASAIAAPRVIATTVPAEPVFPC